LLSGKSCGLLYCWSCRAETTSRLFPDFALSS
jgi:hypothetical protein